MDPEKAYWSEPWEDDNMENFFVAIIALVMVVLVVVFFWKCCSDNDCSKDEPRPIIPGRNYPITPVYAHELEPGIVVLQSQDGEFFRILQEYNAQKRNKEPLPEGASALPAEIETSTVQYIPHYTRPYYQNQPSAPPVAPETLIDLDISATPPVPPPYSKH